MLRWVPKRELQPGELGVLRLAVPRRPAVKCSRVVTTATGCEACELALCDVDWVSDGLVCVLCGIVYQLASDRVQ